MVNSGCLEGKNERERGRKGGKSAASEKRIKLGATTNKTFGDAVVRFGQMACVQIV